MNDDRARGGSRFNLKYDPKVPANISPQDVMAALAPYVTFSPQMTNESAVAAEGQPVEAPPAAATNGSADPASSLQKGMAEGQVRAILGEPTRSSVADHDGIQVHT